MTKLGPTIMGADMSYDHVYHVNFSIDMKTVASARIHTTNKVIFIEAEDQKICNHLYCAIQSFIRVRSQQIRAAQRPSLEIKT